MRATVFERVAKEAEDVAEKENATSPMAAAEEAGPKGRGRGWKGRALFIWTTLPEAREVERGGAQDDEPTTVSSCVRFLHDLKALATGTRVPLPTRSVIVPSVLHHSGGTSAHARDGGSPSKSAIHGPVHGCVLFMRRKREDSTR